MRILLSGPPSSGKSTQGRRLAAALGLPHVSSGDLIRRDAALAQMVADGSLAPSGVIAGMVERRLSEADCEGGFVLDGFPRKPMEAAFVAMRFRIDALLVLETDEATLLSRVRSRKAAGRADDDPAAFPRRIAAYESDTRAAQRELVRHGIPLIPVSAAGTAEETECLIAEAVATFADRRSLRFA